jgi:excisionase family DNA binding protein
MEMLTVQDIAQQLRVSSSLVYGLISAGKIPCHRIGRGRGAIRVRRDDLDRFLDGCRVEKELPDRRLPKPRLKHLKL